MDRPGRPRARALALLAALLVAVSLLAGWHWAALGWRDKHIGYPQKPYGYNAIVSTFGPPCAAATHQISLLWVASNNFYPYIVHFHRKLGGYPTEMVGNQGGTSTNLDNDIYGHIRNAHLDPWVKSGIWGYACRAKRLGSTWSTHAWGIAVDVSAAYECFPGCYTSTVNWHHAPIWIAHGWTWGIQWGDPMHFQYASGY